MELAAHRDALLETCRRTPGVTSLVVFGSSAGDGASRRDEWSDLDFNLFLAADAAPELAGAWPFLPHPDQLVMTAHEGENGGVALYADGMLYEFGAGHPWTIRDPDREVLLDGGDLAFAAPDPLPAAAMQVRVFLAKLYIGVGRVRRGERVAGNAHVRTYALVCLAEALRQRLVPGRGRDRRAPRLVSRDPAAVRPCCDGCAPWGGIGGRIASRRFSEGLSRSERRPHPKMLRCHTRTSGWPDRVRRRARTCAGASSW